MKSKYIILIGLIFITLIVIGSFGFMHLQSILQPSPKGFIQYTGIPICSGSQCNWFTINQLASNTVEINTGENIFRFESKVDDIQKKKFCGTLEEVCSYSTYGIGEETYIDEDGCQHWKYPYSSLVRFGYPAGVQGSTGPCGPYFYWTGSQWAELYVEGNPDGWRTYWDGSKCQQTFNGGQTVACMGTGGTIEDIGGLKITTTAQNGTINHGCYQEIDVYKNNILIDTLYSEPSMGDSAKAYYDDGISGSGVKVDMQQNWFYGSICSAYQNEYILNFPIDAIIMNVSSTQEEYLQGENIKIDVRVLNNLKLTLIGTLEVEYETPTILGTKTSSSTKEVVINSGENTFQYLIPTIEPVRILKVRPSMIVYYPTIGITGVNYNFGTGIVVNINSEDKFNIGIIQEEWAEVRIKSEAESLREEIDLLEGDIGRLQELLNEKARILNQLELTLQEQLAIIDSYELLIEEKAYLISQLELNLAQQSQLITELTSVSEEQAILINALDLSVQQQAEIISQMQLTNQQQAIIISNLELNIQEQAILINSLNLNIQEKSEIISNLELNIQQQANLISQMQLTSQEQINLIIELDLTIQEQAVIINNLELNIQQQAQIIDNLNLNLQQKIILINQLEITNQEQQDLISQMELSFADQQEIIEALNLLISDDAQQIIDLHLTISQQAEYINNLELNIQQQANLISQLQLSNQEMGQLISQLDLTISQQAQLINDLELIVEEDAQIISQLNLNLQQQAQLILELDLSNKEMAQLIIEFDLTIQEQASLIDALQLTVEEKGRIIAELRLTLKEEAEIINQLRLTIDEQIDLIHEFRLSLEEEQELVNQLKLTIEEQQQIIDGLKEKDNFWNFLTEQMVLVILIGSVLLLALIIILYLIFKK